EQVTWSGVNAPAAFSTMAWLDAICWLIVSLPLTVASAPKVEGAVVLTVVKVPAFGVAAPIAGGFAGSKAVSGTNVPGVPPLVFTQATTGALPLGAVFQTWSPCAQVPVVGAALASA